MCLNELRACSVVIQVRIVAVADAFHDPGGFQFYKNRRVIGCASWSQHGCDVQLQWIIAGQIEQIFAVCQNRIAGAQPQFRCHGGA